MKRVRGSAVTTILLLLKFRPTPPARTSANVLALTAKGLRPSLNAIWIVRAVRDVLMIRGPSAAWRLNEPAKGLSDCPSWATGPCRTYEYTPLAGAVDPGVLVTTSGNAIMVGNC